jgi:hypothetical protein
VNEVLKDYQGTNSVIFYNSVIDSRVQHLVKALNAEEEKNK